MYYYTHASERLWVTRYKTLRNEHIYSFYVNSCISIHETDWKYSKVWRRKSRIIVFLAKTSPSWPWDFRFLWWWWMFIAPFLESSKKNKQIYTEIKWMVEKMMWKMLLDTGELPVHMWDYKVIKCIYDVINWINSLRSNYLTDFHQIKTRTQSLRSNWVRINSHSVQFDSFDSENYIE